jgi:hypothetical protein
VATKHVYVLEHFEANQPTVVGIFETRKKAEKTLKTLRKRYSYAIYELPLNTVLTAGKELKDQQGIFEHWHYGTEEVEYVCVSDEGEEIDSGTRIEVTWPK